jgi:hypothetical protein
MPVSDQEPAAQADHACYRRAILPVPVTAGLTATAPCATHDERPRCQERRPPSIGQPETQRSADRSAVSIRAAKQVGAGGRMIGLVLGPGGIVGEWTAGRLHFVAGEILAAAIIIVPLLTGTILVMVVVFGGTKSSDRVFRLLRWFSDKEEPPAPALSPPGPLLTSTSWRGLVPGLLVPAGRRGTPTQRSIGLFS